MKKMSEFTAIKEVKKSKKSYRCDWCGQSINKGSNYYRFAQVIDGNFSSYGMHDECYSAWVNTDWTKFDTFDFRFQTRGITMQESLKHE